MSKPPPDDRAEPLRSSPAGDHARPAVEIDTLVRGVAHEIRNPLNATSLQLEMLERNVAAVRPEELRNKLADRVTRVRKEVARMSRLFDSFLLLARPQRLERCRFRVGDVVDEVVASKQRALTAGSLEVQLSVESKVVNWDRHKIWLILDQLLDNAIDAMQARPGGVIEVRSHTLDDGRVEVSVRDPGEGIAEAVADTLLEPFVTTRQAGRGLGLTIVHALVSLHGGTLELQSGDAGTEARFRI